MKKLVDIARQNGFDELAFKRFMQGQVFIPLKSYAARNDSVADEDAEQAVTMFRQYISPSKEDILADEKKRRAAEERDLAISKVILTSGASLEGYTIQKFSDFISADAVTQIDRGTLASFLSSSLNAIREQALWKLKETAYALGANAVVGVTFHYLSFEPENIVKGFETTHYYEPYVISVTASGNAVVIKSVADSGSAVSLKKD